MTSLRQYTVCGSQRSHSPTTQTKRRHECVHCNSVASADPTICVIATLHSHAIYHAAHDSTRTAKSGRCRAASSRWIAVTRHYARAARICARLRRHKCTGHRSVRRHRVPVSAPLEPARAPAQIAHHHKSRHNESTTRKQCPRCLPHWLSDVLPDRGCFR